MSTYQSKSRYALFCISIFLLVLVLVGCADDNQQLEDTLRFTTITVPFSNCEPDFPVADVPAVTLYFVNEGHLPYIEVATYLDLIDSMSRLESDEIVETEDQLSIAYNPIPNQHMFLTNKYEQPEDPTYEQTMTIDFTFDTVTVSSYLFFFYQGEQSVDTVDNVVHITQTSIQEGTSVTIPFGDYGFDFLVRETKEDTDYLLPFHVASLLFTNSTLYRTYYNGDAIIGGGRCIHESSRESSSLNGEEVPKDVRLASYNMFTLALDYFSAIKQARDVPSYHDLFVNRLASLTTVDSASYYAEFTKLLYQLDDLHADLPMSGYYSSSPADDLPTYPAWYRPVRESFWDTRAALWARFITKFPNPDPMPAIRLLNNETVAVIHLYQFTATLGEEMSNVLADLPETITDVVVDLSMNGGGNVNAIFLLLGFMTDDPITFTNGIAIDGSRVTYTVEVEEEAVDVNWFILTSNGSFSAAHITPMLAQQNNFAVVLGDDTLGGASAVEWVFLPCGFSHTISGNYTFYSSTGTSEFGNGVDVQMNDLFDDQELIDLVEHYKED